MTLYQGIPVSPGIAIGESFVYTKDLLIPKYSISDLQVKIEIERFYTALKNTRTELTQLKNKLSTELNTDESKF